MNSLSSFLSFELNLFLSFYFPKMIWKWLIVTEITHFSTKQGVCLLQKNSWFKKDLMLTTIFQYLKSPGNKFKSFKNNGFWQCTRFLKKPGTQQQNNLNFHFKINLKIPKNSPFFKALEYIFLYFSFFLITRNNFSKKPGVGAENRVRTKISIFYFLEEWKNPKFSIIFKLQISWFELWEFLIFLSKKIVKKNRV